LLLSLIDDITENAKFSKGQFILQNASFAISDLFEEIKDMFEIQCKGKGVILSFDSLDVEVISDRKRLKQVLLNLISNSLKFTDNG